MIWAWIGLGWFVLEVARGLAYRLTGFRLTVTILPIAYTDARVFDWNWRFGKAHTNDHDDPTDLRHIPRTLRDIGFSVEPLWLRVQCKRTVVVRDGSGRFYDNEEQRLRVHESQRKRVGKVLPDYTDKDLNALMGKDF